MKFGVGEGDMPVEWELHSGLLIVRLIGGYEYDERAKAVIDAVRDPAFLPCGY